MDGNEKAAPAPKIDHDKIRQFQQRVAGDLSRTPPPATRPTPTATSPHLKPIGHTSAFKRALQNAERESSERLNSDEWQAAQEQRIQRQIELEAERVTLWLQSIDTACKLPPKLHGISWDDLDAGDQHQVAAVRAWSSSTSRSPFLYLAGPIGRGKTVLAALCLRDLVGQHGGWDNYRLDPERYGLFIKSRQLIASLRPYGDGVDRYMTMPVLLIDDIGTENVTSWGYEHLLAVIDERYDNHKPTILTSNFTLDELTSALGDGGRVADRISEVATPITFTDDDPNWRRM